MIKRLGRAALMLSAGCFAGRGSARASDNVSERLDRLATSLTQQHDVKRPKNAHDSIAVFDFSTSEKLAKERAGFAVSELIMQKLVRANAFTVVERSALQKVLDEQKLQKTDAIDPMTAVKVGRLVGSHLLLMGSIDKIGATYQVNSRIVLVESGEVVAAAYEEFPKKAFEEEAKPYMALVPEEQSIGFYFAVLQGSYAVKKLGPATVSGTSPGGTAYNVTVTPRNGSAGFGQLGIGFRYSPVKAWIVDAALLGGNLGGSIDGTAALSGGTAIGPGNNGGSQENTTPISLRIAVDHRSPLSRQFSGYLGGGLLLTTVQYNGDTTGRQFTGGSDTVKVYGQGGGTESGENLNVPFLRGGFEWHPQPRFHVSLLGTYSVGDVTATRKQKISVTRNTGSSDVEFTSTEIPVSKLVFPKLLVEANIGFSF